jgi:uncharacterized membrane protein YkvA (DUF1232 family)
MDTRTPWTERARMLRRDVVALWFALRDPRTPRAARVLGWLIVGYALSPIDLIPDFIPVLGYLDDLVLLPLGIALVLRMIPAPVMAAARARAALHDARPRNWVAAALIVLLWIGLALLAARAAWRILEG